MNILIRNVERETVEKIDAQAASARRSRSQQVIYLLERALAEEGEGRFVTRIDLEHALEHALASAIRAILKEKGGAG